MNPNDGRILFNHGEIEMVVGQLSTAARDLGTHLEDLKNYLRPLEATWEGATSTEYRQYQRQWDESAAELQSMLGRLASAAGAGNQTMQDADRRAAAGWQG